MSWECRIDTQPIARKNYHCDAYQRIMDCMSDEDFTPDELLCIQGARADRGKILKGTKYDKITGKFDGDFQVWRARLDMLSIYLKYKLYED